MRKLLTAAGLAAAVLAVAACASSSSSTSSAAPSGTPAAGASSASTVLEMSVGGTEVLTNSAGFTLYWFAPDTSTTSKCTGSCATYWPPLKGPVSAGSGVSGTLGVITRPDGTMQATYDGHPLYTYAGDTSPGQNKGNGLNVSGGAWHEVTVSGAAPASGTTSSHGGYGY